MASGRLQVSVWDWGVSGPCNGLLEDAHWTSQERGEAETSWTAPKSWRD